MLERPPYASSVSQHRLWAAAVIAALVGIGIGETFERITPATTFRTDNLQVDESATFESATSAVTFTNGPSGINGYSGTHLEWNEEWMATYANGSITGPFNVTTNSGNAAIGTVTASGRPGIIQMQTGTSTSTGNIEIQTANTFIDFGAFTQTTLSSTLGFEALSNGTDTYAFFAGYCDAAAASINCTDGCGFLYDQGNVATGGVNTGNANTWEATCASNSSRTFYLLNGTGNCDVGPAGTANVAAYVAPNTNIQTMTVTVTPTLATFKVNNTVVCQINTNIPSGSSRVTGAQQHMLKSAGSTSRVVDIDRTMLSIDLPTPRSP